MKMNLFLSNKLKMPAHSIRSTTIIGFVSNDKLLYVTKNYEVAELDTDKIVSTGGPQPDSTLTVDSYADLVADHTHAVFGRDIAPGIAMTVAKRNAKPNTNIGIAITNMRINDDSGSWSVVKTLKQKHAARLMHKWYIEHGLMDLYIKNKYTAFSGFREWVCGSMIDFFHADNRLQWYKHSMNIDYEMELKNCNFTDCTCDLTTPSDNPRMIIPYTYYDDFGLFNSETRKMLWKKGKPETEEEANMILHKARMKVGA